VSTAGPKDSIGARELKWVILQIPQIFDMQKIGFRKMEAKKPPPPTASGGQQIG
jgi:hypothetical protein